MRPLPFVILFRASLLVAIAACAALVIEYQNAGDPAFCGPGSPCAAVRASELSGFFSGTLKLSLPQIGLAAHVALLAGSLLATTRLHLRLLAAVALAGSAFALVLIYQQAITIKAFCPWCIAVDASSILAALAAVLAARTAPDRPPGEAPPWSTTAANTSWGAAAALAVALPYVWAEYTAAPAPPPAIAALQVPGKATVISFTDFECPYCRVLHPHVAALEKAHGDRIHFERRMVPLDFHPAALPAAKVYLCTPEERREAVADALYTAEPAAMIGKGSIEIAAGLGVDREALARCVDSPETAAALAGDKALYRSLGTSGVPLTYVGPRVVLGANPAKLTAAIDRELASGRASLPLPWLFVALGLVIAGASVVTWRTATRRPAPKPAPAGASGVG